MIVVGIDPGTGKTSPTALVAFNPETKQLYQHLTINAEDELDEHRIVTIADAVATVLKSFEEYDDVLVCVETFVMRGKGGMQLQRLIGGILARIPRQFKVRMVYNTTVKRVVAGSGRASKEEVGRAICAIFSEYRRSWEVLWGLLTTKQWDLLDAAAIGFAGWCAKEE